MTYEEFDAALDTYYTFRLASEPIAPGSPEERFRLSRLADKKKRDLWNRIGAMNNDFFRMVWIGQGNLFDELAGMDVHERAAFYAHTEDREEPTDEDYANAARGAIDLAMQSK